MNHEDEAMLAALRLISEEERYYMDLYHRQLTFFWGGIGLALGATTAGFINASEKQDYWAILVGPLVAMLLLTSLSASLRRCYQRFLECIASRAKIESRLGFDQTSPSQALWPNEGIVHSRHFESRLAIDSSASFVDRAMGSGLLGTHRFLLRGLFVVMLAASVAISLVALNQ